MQRTGRFHCSNISAGSFQNIFSVKLCNIVDDGGDDGGPVSSSAIPKNMTERKRENLKRRGVVYISTNISVLISGVIASYDGCG